MRTLVAVFAAGAMLGRGGSDEPSNTSGEAPTKAEFIKQADAICQDAQDELGEFREAEPESLDELADLVAEAARATDPLVDDFRALGAPEGDEEVVNEYLSLVEQNAALLRRLEEAAEAGDTSEVQTYLEDLRDIAERQEGLAQGYGFEVCGNDQS